MKKIIFILALAVSSIVNAESACEVGGVTVTDCQKVINQCVQTLSDEHWENIKKRDALKKRAATIKVLRKRLRGLKEKLLYN